MTIPGLRYVSLLAGLIFLGFRDAVFGVCAIIFDYHNHPTKWWWGSELPQLRTTFYTSAAALGMLALQANRFPIARVLKSRFAVLTGVLFVLMFVRFNAYSPSDHAFWLDKDFKSLLVALLFASTVRSSGRMRLVFWVLVIGCWGLGIEAWRNPRRDAGRLYGVGVPDAFSDNMFAAHLALTVPFLLDAVIRGPRWEKVLAVLGGAFIANAIILTSSRGGFIAVVVAAGVYVCVALRDPRARRVAIGVSLVGLVGSISLVDEVFLERIQSILGEENPWTQEVEMSTGAGRTEVWEGALPMVFDYPMGLGAGGFRVRSPDYLAPELWSFKGDGTPVKAAHNTYLLVLIDFGWLAFGAFVFLLIAMGRFYWRVHAGREDDGDPDFDRGRFALILGSMLASLVTTFMFVDRIHYDWFFYMIGLTIGLQLWERPSSPASPEGVGVTPRLEDEYHVAGVPIRKLVIGMAVSLIMLL